MPKPCTAANLAMRFYAKDGWTKKELDSYCYRGEFLMTHPNDTDPYYILPPSASYDVDALLNATSTIRRLFKEQHSKTDRQLFEERNW